MTSKSGLLSDNRIRLVIRYAVGMMIFIPAALLSASGHGVVSMLLFLLLLALEGFLIFTQSRNFMDLRLLLTVSWLFGIALSVLSLSELQSPWSRAMWLSVGGFYFMFLAGFDVVSLCFTGKKSLFKKLGERKLNRSPVYAQAVYSSVLILTAVCLIGFLAECVILGFRVPLFAAKTYEAYSQFHVSGLHYFTVSLVLVPPLTVCFLDIAKPDRKQAVLLALCNGAAFLVPVILLSKMQLLLSIVLPVFAYLVLHPRLKKRTVVRGVIALAVLIFLAFLVLMKFKNYPEGYLESIFLFKKRDTPLVIQYPYIYIVNNYENLNLLTINLQHYSYGIRQLFPFFALTGLKFLPAVQEIMAVEQYTTIEELTTLTILYHVYGDFGVPGTFVFGLVLGGVSALITDFACVRQSAGAVLLYAQFAVYMLLSFFTTWFSDATTWFYFIATFAISVYIRIYCDRKGEPLYEKTDQILP